MNVTLFRDLPTEGWPSMERYADELAAGLSRVGCTTQSYVWCRPLPWLRGRMGALANYAWRSTAYPLAARRHQGDVNHIVDHSYAHLLGRLDARRTVVTCHDLAPLALDERGRGFSRRLWDRSFRAMLRAARIIADSAHTRDEILRYSDYSPGEIRVVPLGVSPAFFEPVAEGERAALRRQHGLPDWPTVVHIGNCQPRKNVEAILRAMAMLGEVAFVQIGGRFSSSQLALSRALGVSERVRQIPVALESELRAWLQTAAVCVLPSLYEGFGLPALEAMAAGTPVVCAAAAALPEVAGDAALLIDPHDPATLAAAIQAVFTDMPLASDLRRRGIERAQQFTWERTARLTMDVYEGLAQSPPSLPGNTRRASVGRGQSGCP